MQLTVDAFLFDLDGTLIDSTPCVDRSWRKAAERIGVDFDAMQGSHHGVPSRQTLTRLMPGASDAEIDEINDWLADLEMADTDGIVVLPGTRRILSELPPDRWAIVTSGVQRLARARIAAAGLPEPAVLVTADMVPIGKPDPAPYLLGARLLGVEAKHCLVVEDAPAGVSSGLAAGATVLGLRTTHTDLGVPSVANLSEVTLRITGDRIGVSIPEPS